MTHPKQAAHNSTGGKALKKLLVTKSNTPTPTRKRISPEVSLALKAEWTAVIGEAKHLISSPAFFPDSSSSDPLKLQGAKDIMQGMLKYDLEALLDKKCYKELKEAFEYLCCVNFFDPVMVLRLERMNNDVETELPHYEEAKDECFIGREQAKDLQHALKSLKAKLEAACAIKPRIIELENELLDIKEKIEALQAQYADCRNQKKSLEAKMDAETGAASSRKGKTPRQVQVGCCFQSEITRHEE